MNRIIKFRAIRDDMSDFTFKYGCIAFSFSGVPRIMDGYSNLYYTCIKGTEGQFTGLLDRNGVEIYEGDIVKIEHSSCNFDIDIYCTVIYKGNGFKACVAKENELLKIGATMDIWNDFEVVGNIHETEDLLKC